MMSILRIFTVWKPPAVTDNIKHARSLFLYPKLQVKQIQATHEENKLIIDATIVPSEREPYLLKNSNPGICPVCASGLDIKHTDVLILSQFVRSDGCMLPRRITGLCRQQQVRMSAMVTMAQKAGLMPNLNPPQSKKDPKKRQKWKRFNKYFDESTIKLKYYKNDVSDK